MRKITALLLLLSLPKEKSGICNVWKSKTDIGWLLAFAIIGHRKITEEEQPADYTKDWGPAGCCWAGRGRWGRFWVWFWL